MTATAIVGAGAPVSDTGLRPDPVPAVDETAETMPDTASTLDARRAGAAREILLVATQSAQQQLQARLDAMRARFNGAQEVRAERLRQMNMLRDMAMEQAKHDDEILKKYIAMI